MDKMYVTIVDKADPEYHRSPIIIHKNESWYFAEFETMRQLRDFMDFAGLEMTLEEERPYFKRDRGTWRKYSVNRLLDDPCNGWFWKLSDIPVRAKRFTGLSNGSLVDCYLYNDGQTIHIYRPNSNAKEVYKPLPLEEHIEYIRKHGIM